MGVDSIFSLSTVFFKIKKDIERQRKEIPKGDIRFIAWSSIDKLSTAEYGFFQHPQLFFMNAQEA